MWARVTQFSLSDNFDQKGQISIKFDGIRLNALGSHTTRLRVRLG